MSSIENPSGFIGMGIDSPFLRELNLAILDSYPVSSSGGILNCCISKKIHTERPGTINRDKNLTFNNFSMVKLKQ